MKRLHNTKIIIILTTLIASSGLGLYLYYQKHSNSRPRINYNSPTKDQINTQNNIQKNTQNSNNQNIKVQAFISRLSQSVNGGDVQVRLSIYNLKSGFCNINFYKGGDAIIKQFEIVSDSTFYTCKDANITSSEFPTSGRWNVSINLSDGTNNIYTINSYVYVNQ